MMQMGAAEDDQRKNLIINYLPPDMQEEDLVSLFSPAGAIESVRIMKNYDGTTKGYGFVRFQNEKDAEKAINLFDGLSIRGKKLKVAISRPGGTRDNANLFVTHIPAKWTSEILQHNFSIFGEVVEARILEKEGTSRLCGFVRYNKSEDALKALRHRDGWTPPRTHRQLKVTLATKPQRFGSMRRSRRSSQSGVSGNVYSLSPESWDSSRSLHMTYAFEQHNHHSHSHPSYSQPSAISHSDSFSQKHPSYSHPSTISHSDSFSHERFEYMNSRNSMYEAQELQQEQVEVMKDQIVAATNRFSLAISVFVYNLPVIFTDKDVKSLCGQYGAVQEVDVQIDNDGRSLGMAFVTFNDSKDTVKAREGLSGCEILHNTIEVEML